jgi:hypothetical protein
MAQGIIEANAFPRHYQDLAGVSKRYLPWHSFYESLSPSAEFVFERRQMNRFISQMGKDPLKERSVRYLGHLDDERLDKVLKSKRMPLDVDSGPSVYNFKDCFPSRFELAENLDLPFLMAFPADPRELQNSPSFLRSNYQLYDVWRLK